MNVRPVQNMSGVYALLAHGGDGVYVGSSHHVIQRIDSHFMSLRKGRHHCAALLQAFQAGEDFNAVVLEQCPIEQLAERETVWLHTLGPLYNRSKSGEFGHKNLGRKMPHLSDANRSRTGVPWQPFDREQWLDRLSATKTGQKWGPRDPSVGRKIAASLRGQPLSEERKAKISAAHKRFHAQLREQGLVQRRPRRTS